MLALNASGCLDALTGAGTARQLDAFVTKTVTPEPRDGNPPVRIAETDSGMLNSIGLANPGREQFLAETLPALRSLGLPISVSVGGFAARDYVETCERLDDDTVELNLSCPNVDEAPEGAAEIVTACREATDLPRYAKLSPASWDIAATARTGSPASTRCEGSRSTTAFAHGSRASAVATRDRRCGRSRSRPSTRAAGTE